MKRALIGIFALGIASLAGAASISETADSRPLHVGFQAGMSFSNLNTPQDLRPSNRSGIAAGVNFELPVTAFFSVQPEAMFVQKGADILSAGNVSFAAKYNSIEVPVLAKFKLPGEVTPFLLVGPVAVFNLSSTVETSAPGGGAALGFNPRTFDVAGVIGAGVEVGPIFASARYSVGLTELNQNAAQWKSRGFYLLAGLRI